jgi:transcriptional regulator with XRE-family HTH domain
MYLLMNNMTLTAFCEKINYDITYLSKIAKGKRKPGIKLAKIIETATNGQVTVDDLLKGE